MAASQPDNFELHHPVTRASLAPSLPHDPNSAFALVRDALCTDALYLVLDSKFKAFQLINPGFIMARMLHFRGDRGFQLLMTRLQRFQMSFYRHVGLLRCGKRISKA
jgi:hypothetical protein